MTTNMTRFAHTILADFEHPRHMSAGVAVLSGIHLGDPTIQIILSDHIEQVAISTLSST